jgi:xylan 1,4-beta-xylosidase
MIPRRTALQTLSGLPLIYMGGCAAGAGKFGGANADRRWGDGYEGQRIADRGDGTFLNPIVAGDHPDPSIIKDGDAYYLAFSSFDAYPGLLIWRSYDLVNWEPLAPALQTPIGSVWAPDLAKHDERYYLYIPARTADYKSIYVISADSIEGPWSEPIDLKLPDHIDPCHVVGEDGRRYLFLSNGDLVPLSDDGLSTDGEVVHVYDPWRYPAEWDVECFCPEGPKIMRRGEWFYMLTAVGGTAGPPTGHMVIAARSKSVFGPWEDAPNNPIVRTQSAAEQWWSRGHATLIEGPSPDDWWLIYHGYEKNFWTLGRQCLLEPARWRDDGWFEALGGDLSSPMQKPAGGRAVPHGLPLSDDFSEPALRPQWAFYDPAANEGARVNVGGGVLALAAKGTTPADASPLCFVCGDLAYEFEAEIERDPGAAAGLLLYYNRNLYCGLGFDARGAIMHRYGMERRHSSALAGEPSRLHIRLRNDRHIVTMFTSADGEDWTKFDVQIETSGYHHNVAYDFLSLRPAIYAAGAGAARFRSLKYRALR